MTDPVPHPEQTAAHADTAVSAAPAAAAPALPAAAAEGVEAAAAPAVAPAPGEGSADSAPATPAPDTDSSTGSDGRRRGGRNRRKGAGSGAAGAAQGQQLPAQPRTPTAEAGAKAPRGPRPIPPALEKLAALYPQLFGAVFRPLKRGIFQDLLAAHPEEFEREALKVALGVHTRSTRYLQSVAAGQQRHDLQGQAVEAMAPEHVHQALLEVHRRRSGRGTGQQASSPEELLAKLRARIVANIEASGLSREAYAERVRTRDETANALLDEALAEMAAKTAREEALVRAFESSGKTVEAFADMYGMDPRSVSRSLHNAQARARVATEMAAQQTPAGEVGGAGEAPAAAEEGAGQLAEAAPAPADADADAPSAPEVPVVERGAADENAAPGGPVAPSAPA